MQTPIITLTTDFGLRDPYVAEMKAVILDIRSDIRIVDISHEIERFNIAMGAYMLATACIYFPKNTVHVAVVDPGVGTERRAILIQTEKDYFIGPDNGVLALASQSQNIKKIYSIENPQFMLQEVSRTFHGRDIFAPAAAHLADGTLPSDFGPEKSEMVTPSFAQVSHTDNALTGEVIHIDRFGNVVTNIRRDYLESLGIKGVISLELESTNLELELCRAYGEVEKRKLLAIVGSHSFLEISINQGNAAEVLKAKVGDRIKAYLS